MKCKKQWDRITAIVAIITSIISVILATVSIKISSEQLSEQLNQTRKHNKLMVKPEFSFYRRLSRNDKKIGIGIENKGFGPARVTGLVYGINSKWGKNQGWSAGAKILRNFTKEKNFITIGSVSDNGSTIINSGEKKWLYSYVISPDNEFDKAYPIFMKLSDNINIAVCYCSLYDECEVKTLRGVKPPLDILACKS